MNEQPDNHAAEWWRQPLRIVQTNLQVRDTERIDPRRLAEQLQALSANALVFNAGGIYAWYPSQVPYHHVNEFLPTDRDLMADVIEACHQAGIKFIARFDFSRAEDLVWLQRPQWFARSADGQPQAVGAMRPGPWSLLMNTCINSGYRNEALALPVLEEVLANYAIDGIFFNNPGYTTCHCERCRRLYAERYGRELPSERAAFAADWPEFCVSQNMAKLYGFLKRTNPGVPMILYYHPQHADTATRAPYADMLCTEAQNVLSLGRTRLSPSCLPAVSVKLGRGLPGKPAPNCIIHSSPGMDWRHTGLPQHEYRFWLSQIPANGGNVWHSLTGIPDTIGDKRVLAAVEHFDRDAALLEPELRGAAAVSEALLIWNASEASEGWAEALTDAHVQFDVCVREQVEPERLRGIRAVIVPSDVERTDSLAAVLTRFASEGGRLIVDGGHPDSEAWRSLLGIAEDFQTSEPLTASYLRFEGADNSLARGMEATVNIALRGRVAYCRPSGTDTRILATLVPPFSPLESVGAPPERASLPVERTDLPLSAWRGIGEGGVLYTTFDLGALIREYGLADHARLAGNAVRMAIGGSLLVESAHLPGLQLSLFRQPNGLAVHFVNGVGARPLQQTVPLHDVTLDVQLQPGERVERVTAILKGQDLEFVQTERTLRFSLPQLQVWECVSITSSQGV